MRPAASSDLPPITALYHIRLLARGYLSDGEYLDLQSLRHDRRASWWHDKIICRLPMARRRRRLLLQLPESKM